MHWTVLVVGCALLGGVPGDAPLPAATRPLGSTPIYLPDGGKPPDVLPTIAETGPAEAAAAGPETAPAVPIAGDEAETPEASPWKARRDTAAADTVPVFVPPAQSAPTPPAMVAEALVPPPDSRLTGRPLTLLAAVSSTDQRQRQIEVTHAYWRLAEAVVVYWFSLDHDRRLRGFAAGGAQEPLGRTARASSAALVREAEVAAVAAQHELAELAALSLDAPLPLPADRPHVGPYRTHFDQLFSSRTAPARTRLIDRTLPIRCRAIDGRASAVQAAQDALTAAVDAHRSGRADLPDVLACMEEYLRQRQAFIYSVCRYNHEIADYALSVAGAGSSGQVLVGMLIQPTPQSLRPLVSGGDGWVEPAGHNQRILTPAPWPGQRIPTPAQGPLRRVPTPARRPGQNVSTPDLPGTVPRPLEQQAPSPAARWSPSQPADKKGPTLAPRPEETESSQPSSPEPPRLPGEPQPAEPTPGTVNKPITDARGGLAAPALYPALTKATPQARAKQLTLTLHWARALPEQIGAPISLGDSLGRQSGGDRGELIGAYWLVGQRAAEYQVLEEQVGLLDGLAVVPPQNTPQGSALRLRSASLDTQAALHEAHAALLEAQFELATQLGQESDALWPIPSTPPRSEPYARQVDARTSRPAESWRLRRLAAMIPGLAESVQQRAAAVVEADAARAAAITPSSSEADAPSSGHLLAAIRRQTQETFAFLAALTDYNRAIAEYALTVLPPDTPPDKLAAALIVGPESDPSAD